VRLGLPIMGGLLTTGGLLLAWKGHEAAPWMLITGALITASIAAAEVLEVEQHRGRI